jgi:hypothetical protein
MKTRSARLLVALSIISTTAFAQIPNVEVAGSANGNTAFRYNDPTAMGKKAPDVSYKDIDGKYFWKEDWKPALITMKAGSTTKMKAVRLNLYTNDIHYLTDEGEMAAQTGKVKSISFLSDKSTDTTTVVARFEMVRNGTKESLYEILNEGQIQLLRRVTMTVKKDGFDAATAKDKYHFDSDTDYFIRNGTELKPIKGLSKSSIFEAVPTASTAEAWLSENKNKLKKPEDIAQFLAYLSTQTK